RELAAAELASAPDGEGSVGEIRSLHTAYYARICEHAVPRLMGVRQRAVLDELEEDMADIRKAFADAASDGDWYAEMRIASSLRGYWLRRGPLSEAEAWLTSALAAGPEEADLRAAVLLAAAGVATALRKHDVARERAEAAMTIAEERGDLFSVADAENRLGVVAFETGDVDGAVRAYSSCLATARRGGFTYWQAIAASNLGGVQAEQLHWSAAAESHAAAVEAFRELGDQQALAVCLDNLGDALVRLGAYSDARQALGEALRVRVALDDDPGIASSLEAFARLAAFEGVHERSARLLGAAESLRGRIGAPMPLPARTALEESLAGVGMDVTEASLAPFFEEGRSMDSAGAVAFALRDGWVVVN
ncbi:MAG TPA: hypothetical protein VGS21_06865, partial [Acidimicrobiales bacterium]|nr:hypothetical protein [Acidimicrobiales bacterium]